jgi:hypothetical protein
MANEEQQSILKKGGITAWNTWRTYHREIIPDLVDADLSGASLVWADLRMANLGGANLNGADLRMADLGGADLRVTNLCGANLNGAELFVAKLSRADLRGAMLIKTDLSGADLSGADLSASTMWLTSVSNIDLSGVKGLETVKHSGPSSIGLDTICRSKGKIPKAFLKGAGVPENFILSMDSLVWEGFEFYSCFISHSTGEEDFACRMYKDLKGRDVQCCRFPEDAKWGEPVWGEIDRATKVCDKVVVLCSEQSLQSGPVLREIERALQREDRENKSILFPVRLDDFLFEKWEHPRKADVMSKVVGDFRGCEDQKVYDKALGRLVLALNKPQSKGGA